MIFVEQSIDNNYLICNDVSSETKAGEVDTFLVGSSGNPQRVQLRRPDRLVLIFIPCSLAIKAEIA